MEQSKVIEWEIQKGHPLSGYPLGYKVEIAEDSFYSRLCFVNTTFSDSKKFRYLSKVERHFLFYPPEGLRTDIGDTDPGIPIRFTYEQDKLMKFLAVSKSGFIQRIAPDGQRIMEHSNSGRLNVKYLAIDETNNSIWQTSEEAIDIYATPLKEASVNSLDSEENCLAAIPDGNRHVFWKINTDSLSLNGFDGTVINTWILNVTEVSSHQIISATGDLYFIADGLLFYCNHANGPDIYENQVTAIGKWSYNGILVAGSTGVHLWTDGVQGTLMSDIVFADALSSTIGNSIYIVKDDVLFVYDDLANLISQKQLPEIGIKYIDAFFGCSTSCRPILYCGNNSCGIARDFGDEIILQGVLLSLEGTGDALICSGAANQASVAYIGISPLYADPQRYIDVSSSSSGSSSISSITLSESSLGYTSTSESSLSSSWVRTTSTSVSPTSISSSTRHATTSSSSSQSMPVYDGEIMITTGENGYYAISYDFGLNWTEKFFMPTSQHGTKITMSSNGRYQTIISTESSRTYYYVWRSEDRGINWSQVKSFSKTDRNFFHLDADCSDDGKYQTIIIPGDETGTAKAFISKNYGKDWDVKNFGTYDFNIKSDPSITMSSDGSTQIAGIRYGDGVWKSIDYGDSWALVQPQEISIGCQMIGSWSNATKLIGIDAAGGFQKSEDQGITWNRCFLGRQIPHNLEVAKHTGVIMIIDSVIDPDERMVVITSPNGGDSWAPQEIGSVGWIDDSHVLSITKTGKSAVAVVVGNSPYNKSVYISNDMGLNFTRISTMPKIPIDIAISSESAYFAISSQSSLNSTTSESISSSSVFEKLRISKSSNRVRIDKYVGPETEAIIPEEIDGLPVTEIKASAFQDNISIVSVSIPNTIISIGDFAFKGCTNLESIELPASVTTLGDGVFENCSKLEEITLPNTIVNVGSGVFKSCTGLLSASIGTGILEISYEMFSNCSNLSIVILPDNLISIGTKAFSRCISLASITIPALVSNLYQECFYDCIGPIEFTFEGHAPSLGTDAFYNDTGVVYHYSGATGFTSPTWGGIPTQAIPSSISSSSSSSSVSSHSSSSESSSSPSSSSESSLSSKSSSSSSSSSESSSSPSSSSESSLSSKSSSSSLSSSESSSSPSSSSESSSSPSSSSESSLSSKSSSSQSSSSESSLSSKSSSSSSSSSESSLSSKSSSSSSSSSESSLSSKSSSSQSSSSQSSSSISSVSSSSESSVSSESLSSGPGI